MNNNHRSNATEGRRNSQALSGWANRYAAKRKSEKSAAHKPSYESSVAVAINSGPQPTLAKRRRQLAGDKWKPPPQQERDNGDGGDEGAPPSSCDDWSFPAPEIIREITNDLMDHHRTLYIAKSHHRITPNTQLMNSRKSFWKRRLSHKSTADFDRIWKDGRNGFMRQVFHGSNNNKDKTKASAAAASSSHPSSSSSSSSKNTTKATTKAASVASHKSHGKTISTKQPSNTRPREDDSPAPRKQQASSEAEEVIDLCDSDDDDDNNESQESRITERAPEDTARKQVTTKNSSTTTQFLDSVVAETLGRKPNEKPAAREADSVTRVVVTKNEPESRTTSPAEKKPKESSSPTAPAVTETSTAAESSTRSPSPEPPPPPPPNTSPKNPWSKLFLGPDFRVENVFSLGDEEWTMPDQTAQQ